MAPIKTCVLGVGLSGLTFHVPFILALPELFTLHAVLERNPKTPGGKLHDRFGVTAKIHRDIDSVLNDPEIELIIVGTPNETHYEYARKALEAGKHVLVDKPVTTTFTHAKELGALAKSQGLVLYGFQNRRWDSDFLALKQLLALPDSDPQSLGDPVEFESHYDRYRNELKHTWKDTSGATYDLGTHLIDQALALFGRPEALTAFQQNVRGIGDSNVDDSFLILMHYRTRPKHPLTVILRAHILSARQPQVRFIVRGVKGTFEKHGLDVQEDQLKAMASPKDIYKEGYGLEPEGIWGRVDVMMQDEIVSARWPSTEPGAYVELFKNLAGAIRNGDEPAVKWSEATAVIEMVELAMKSSREGKTLDVGNPDY